jgi:hypothetical protein
MTGLVVFIFLLKQLHYNIHSLLALEGLIWKMKQTSLRICFTLTFHFSQMQNKCKNTKKKYQSFHQKVNIFIKIH